MQRALSASEMSYFPMLDKITHFEFEYCLFNMFCLFGVLRVLDVVLFVPIEVRIRRSVDALVFLL